jgi:hypothetical protein
LLLALARREATGNGIAPGIKLDVHAKRFSHRSASLASMRVLRIVVATTILPCQLGAVDSFFRRL